MKDAVVLILAVVLMLGCASGLSTTLNENYKSKETMIVEIQGNILELIENSQIEFKRENVRLPFDGEVKKLGEKYYVWAIAPEKPGDYTFYIHNVATTVNGVNSEIEFEQNFSVGNGSISYNARPGALMTRNDFSISVFLFEDVPKTISLNFLGEGSRELKPGENKISFLTSDIEKTQLLNAKIGDYNIPVYVIKPFKENEKYKTDIMTSIVPVEINRVIGAGSRNLYYPIKIKNNGNKTISSIFVSFNNPLFVVEPVELNNLSYGEEKEINFSVAGPLNRSVEDALYIQIENEIVVLPVSLNIGSVNVSLNETIKKGYHCTELGGKICPIDESCDKEVKLSIDGNCCLGNCKKAAASGSSSSKWIGWLLAGIVVVIGLIVLVKYRKAKPSASELDKLLKK